MQTTSKLAEYICATGYEDIDPVVIARAKELSLSALGSSVLGANMDVVRNLAEYVKAAGGPQEAGVIGLGFRTSAEFAAFVNASASHCTELEDVAFPEAVYTCHLIPTVFSLGEKLGASGRTVLEAVVLGYEISARPGVIATNGGAFDRGWLPPPHLGAIGVAAAAAKMLRLDFEKTRNALALAASFASGLYRQTGSAAHVIEAGIAGRNGLTAALLAQRGLTGEPTIMEGKAGYWDALSGHPDLDFELGRGQDFRLMHVGVKRYPCCYFLQRIIDGVGELVTQHDIQPDAVESVEVQVNAFFRKVVRQDRPTNGEEARFSLPHAVSAVLLRDRVFAETFTTAKVNDPRYQAMWPKVTHARHPDWDGGVMESDTPVRIRLKDGREFSKSCVLHKGAPNNPLTWDEMAQRFRFCTEDALPGDTVDQATQMLHELDKLPDVAPLMTLLN